MINHYPIFSALSLSPFLQSVANCPLVRMRIKLSVSREEQEQVLRSVLQELREKEGVEEGWRDTTLVCRDGRLLTNRLLLALLLPAMEVGDHPVLLLPHHTVGEVLGLPGERPPDPAPVLAKNTAPTSAPAYAATFTPAPAFTPAPTFNLNPSHIHVNPSYPHLPFPNTLHGNGLKQPVNYVVEDFVSTNGKKKTIPERHQKNQENKPFCSKTIETLKETPIIRKSLALDSTEEGLHDFLSTSLENVMFVGKDDLKIEEEEYGKTDTEKQEEEKTKKKTRGKNILRKSYNCDFCIKTSTMQSSMIRHMKMHTGEKPFGCKLCTKYFTTTSSLSIHQTVHTGELSVFCEDCGKRYNNNYTLKKHMRKAHGKSTGEKPQCTLCNKLFLTACSLEKHMLTHTGEKPYACNQCNKAFSVVGTLKRHKMSHTGERPFICTSCEKAFTESGKLKRHILNLH